VVKWFNTLPCHGRDRGFNSRLDRHYGSVAQSVEQRTEAPCVAGSIPAGTTISEKSANVMYGVFLFLLFIFKLSNTI
jgi:hypothetical protein